jgi:hypothetical protein
MTQLVKKELVRLDPALRGHETEGDYRAGVVLLAVYWVTGSDIDDLTIFTGYERDFIAQICLRMRKAELWEESSFVHADHWFRNDCYSPANFWADVLVGLGMLFAKPLASGDFCYWSVEQDGAAAPGFLM